MSQYKYRHLDPAKQEIRLLNLQPGEGDSMVEVEVMHQSLADNPVYEAISYVWGDPTVTEDIHIIAPPRAAPETGTAGTQEAASGPPIEPITLEHHLGDLTLSADDSSHDGAHSTYIFKATTNLKSALQHLRTPTKPRVIWADAVCINQKDDAERGHQVRQMDQIYRKCSRVCIWLGDADEDSDLAMELVDAIKESCKAAIRDNSYRDVALKDLFAVVAEQYYVQEKFARHFRALLGLILRPWFSRLWIVQEVILSTTRTVFCGNRQADWGMFLNAFFFLFIHAGSTSKPETFRETNPEIVFHQLPKAVEERWRRLVGRFMRLGTMAINWEIYSPPMLLREALLELRGRSKTDNRDAVYGILSLASDVTPLDLDINYRIDKLEVFKMVTRKMIEKSRCLDILCDGPTCVHGEYILPSWLPRFDGQSLPCGCFLFAGSTLTFHGTRNLKDTVSAIEPVYFASKGRKAEAVAFGEKDQLTTDGIFVDRIHVVMQRPIWTTLSVVEPELTVPKEWFSLALPENSLRNITHHQEGASDDCESDVQKFDTLWRTMIANRDSAASCEPAASQNGEGFRKWLLKNNKCDLVVSPHEVFHMNAHSTFVKFKQRLYATLSYSPTLVITEGGLLGLARGGVAPGDQVCILLGCSVPTILRQVPDTEREEYILMGESYIHGMMDGEAIDKLEKGEYQLQKIIIV